jgi:hypothetical protein
MAVIEQRAGAVINGDLRDTYQFPDLANAYEEDPDVLNDFMESAYSLISEPLMDRDRFSWVDKGRFSFVFGMPEREDMCIKVASQNTMRDVWKSGGGRMRIPNLRTEALFMHAVGRKLERKPESGVKAPAQYAVARFKQGSAMLMEKVPEPYINLRRLPGDIDDRLIELGENCASRFLRALGGKAMRLGMGDIRGEGGVVNLGNFLVDRENPFDSEELYVIDLVGRSLTRQALALASSKTAG